MKAAIGQFAVAKTWEDNARTCVTLMQEAAALQADMLVLPEGILARDIADPDMVLKAAQPLDGPFVQALLAESRANAMTTLFCIHTPASQGKVYNVLVALRGGAVIAAYRKLHLYDAFSMQESRNVTPGDAVPPLIEVAGLKVGLMTCYDIRFPELARRLADDGAEVFALPAAWLRGPLKEHHWETLVTARALENTAYIIAAGECGPRNIGMSLAVDPLGVAIARAAEAPALILADVDPRRIAHARAILPALANRRFARPELAGSATARAAAE